jgi:RHS repeat-associated protein
MPRKARVDEWSRWGKDDIDGKPGGRVSGRRTSQIVASAAGGPWRHHHYDGQGNCIFLTDGWGTILEQYDYDAFGRPYFYNAGGDSIGYSPNNNRFLFTGREWLKDLKVYDYRNRMYQPELGRFLQPDPTEFEAGDYNLYRYCHNDPINRSDPFGLLTWQFAEHFPDWAKHDFNEVINYLKDNSAQYRKLDAQDHRMVTVQATADKLPTQWGYFNNKPYLFIDPYSSTYLTKGQIKALIHLKGNQMPPSGIKGRAITVGHEVGHGTGERDEHDGGRNVEKNENPIRHDLGEKDRLRDFGTTVVIHHDDIDTRRRQ